MWTNSRGSPRPLKNIVDLHTFLAYQIVYLNLIVDRYADYRVFETTPISRLQIYRSIELRTDSTVD